MRRPATQAEPAGATAATPVMARPRVPVWLLAVLLVLGTTALYWPATRCEFINLDDNVNVTANMHVRNGLTLEGIKWAFLDFSEWPGWTPLTMVSHMAVCQLCGLNPWWHHLPNVLLHALNAALVFGLLQRMTGATGRSFSVALLFAVHPLRVEPVAWVTERRDVLSSFFGLLALIAYARYAQRRMQNPATPNAQHVSRFTFHASTYYLLSLSFLALGLMSKPMLATWPFVMLLLDYWPLGRMQNAAPPGTDHAVRTSLWRLVREKIPFFVLAVFSSASILIAMNFIGALAVGKSLPLVVRVETALISYCRYLGKLFWPMDLAVYYAHPGHWPLGQALMATGLILGILVLVWLPRRRYPYLLMGWLWYCGTLLPVSQVIQVGAHAMADRWTYLPSLGVLIMVVWGVCELTQGWRYQALASVTGGMMIVICAALTRHQIGYWQESETLLRHTLAVSDNNGMIQRNLACALLDKGQIDEAIIHFREFVRLRPELGNSHYNLGIALYKKGQLEEAIRQLQETIRLEPDDAAAHYNLGTAFYQQGRIGEAIRQFRETIRLRPDGAEAYNNLGTALGMQGQTDDAIRQFQEALRLKPDYADARKNLGIVLATKSHSPQPPSPATSR